MWPIRAEVLAPFKRCFSALTLGFFDVAVKMWIPRDHTCKFQCPNAGLLRCGLTIEAPNQQFKEFQCPNAGLLRCGVDDSIPPALIEAVSVP